MERRFGRIGRMQYHWVLYLGILVLVICIVSFLFSGSGSPPTETGAPGSAGPLVVAQMMPLGNKGLSRLLFIVGVILLTLWVLGVLPSPTPPQ